VVPFNPSVGARVRRTVSGARGHRSPPPLAVPEPDG